MWEDGRKTDPLRVSSRFIQLFLVLFIKAAYFSVMADQEVDAVSTTGGSLIHLLTVSFSLIREGLDGHDHLLN